MKKLVLTGILFLAFIKLNAQETVGGRVLKNTKDKTYGKVEQKGDEAVDKTLDKIEEGIGSIFKKKDKKKKDKKGSSQNESDNGYQSQSGNGSNADSMPDFSSYEGFDFVPGEKIIFFEDFAQSQEGTKPKNWDGNAEFTTTTDTETGQKALSVIHGGGFFPMGLKTLPQNFTIQFDVVAQPDVANGTLDLRFLPEKETNLADPWFNNVTQISFSGSSQIPKKGGSSIEQKDANGNIIERNDAERYFSEWHTNENPRAKISISKIGDKVSVWINQTKIWDNVTIFNANIKYKLAFHFGDYFIENISFLMMNLKIATNAPQVKNDIAKGKFITANILFDTNSDAIKPQSFSILKEISETLKASPTMKIKIVGHTDSDGDAKSNLELSQRRAEAVKNVLSGAFGVDVSQYTTEGKGESLPLNKNASASEKAQNRRVEFVRQ